MRLTELRKIVGTLMTEGENTEQLAMIVDDEGGMKTVLLYSPQAVVDAVKKIIAPMGEEDDIDTDALTDAIDSSARGMIKIKAPKDPAYGAWEVISSAGKGYGKLLYGLAYALAPNDCVIPDRNKVSPDARAGWQKTAASGRPKKKLDNRDDPKTPEKHDDSKVYGGKDEYLDYAYCETSSDSTEAQLLNKNHETTLQTLYDMLKRWYGKPEHIKRMFGNAAGALFNRVYSGN
jgi:hypothetical protein